MNEKAPVLFLHGYKHTYFGVHDVISYTQNHRDMSNNIINGCQKQCLCDIVNKSRELINTFFGKFLAFFKEIQKNKEGL